MSTIPGQAPRSAGLNQDSFPWTRLIELSDVFGQNDLCFYTTVVAEKDWFRKSKKV